MTEKKKTEKQPAEKQEKKELEKLNEKIEELELKLEEKDKEVAELKDKYLRLVAETDNMRKRLEKEKKDFLEYANENLLKDILPIVDNIERAIEHADDNADIKDFIKGIEMTLANFLKVLEKYNVKPVKALNEPFDPNYHEAMQVQETDEHPPNTVIQEYQKGYTFKERLLRPSLVIVSKESSENSNN